METNEYDVIVVGGGATGSGIALDFASRGFKTLLLEQNDFSEGTSSRSTKLVHGGVRYLEAAVKKLDKAQYNLVREALKERYRILKNASHLSSKLTLVTPVYKVWELPYMFAGLSLYDIISGEKRLGKSKIISKKEVLKTFPNVKEKGLVGAVEYYDGSFNDSKLIISLLKTAEKFGAECKNYHKVEKFIYDKDKISGVIAKDKIENKEVGFKAKIVINATGVFSDVVRSLDDEKAKKRLDLSSGIHIVLDKKYLPSNKGLMIPKTKDGRVLFILPWMGKCLVGTTDESTVLSEHPVVKDSDIDYILEHLEIYFDLKIDKSDILSSWCGIRPLVAPEDEKDTASIVREHDIFSSKSGLISIIGGKWTTYRKMAQEAVDYAIKQNKLKKKKCKTKKLKLIGSEISKKDLVLDDLNIDKKLKKYLFSMYGDKIFDVIKSSDNLEKLHKDYFHTQAELIYCIRNEFVQKPMDFLVRRTSLALIDIKASLEILDKVVAIMKKELNWSEELAKDRFKEAKQLLETNI